MGLVRPTSDIASFPAPGWTTSPLFSDVDDVARDDLTFIVAPVPGAEDPQVALGLGDLEIPYGSSGRIEIRVTMRWSEVLTVVPDTVRVGLADAADLTGDDPTLLFERSLVGTAISDLDTTEFVTFDIVFDYEDFAGTADAFGIYIEMTPNSADATAVGHISWIEVLSCVPAVFIETCSLGSITAGQVIQEARDVHPLFDPRMHPNGTMLRLLSSYQRAIFAKIAQSNPALCASNLYVSLPLADFAAGVKLPSFTYMLPSPTLITENGQIREPIDLVNATFQSDFEQPRKFAYLQGGSLFLGRRAENYNSYNQLRLQMVLTPRDLVGLNDPLMLPDFGMDTYVGHLVTKMAMRMTPPLTGVAVVGEADERNFLAAVAQQKGAEVSMTRDVFPGGW
jgi:hypothetical protein